MSQNLKPEKENIKINVASMHRDIKSAAIAFIGAIVIALAFTMGPAFITLLYFCVALAGIIGYAMYPDQCDAFFKTKQLHLLGASVGFFVAGPLGLLLGAWLVHYTAQQLNVVATQAKTVKNAVQTFGSPLPYVKNFLAKTKEAAADVSDVLSQMGPNFTFSESDDDDEEEDNKKEKEEKEEDNHEKKELSALEKETPKFPLVYIPEAPPTMSWFYRYFCMFPPEVPGLPAADASPLTHGDTPKAHKNKFQP